VAGVVEAVGPDVKELKVGDRVFGSTRGSFAELVRAREKYLVTMPQGFSFEQAAAVPVAATTALQAVRDKARVTPGQRVLVNGAGGGVGTFVVQVAKAHGATVTAVSSAGNLEMLRSIGADEVIDYAKDDITTGTDRYDVLFDLAGNRSIGDYRRVVTDDGAYVVIGGQSGRWIKPMDRVARMMLTDRFTRQRLVFFLAQINRDDLLVLRDLMESGKLTPVIGSTYPLDQVPDAIRQMEAGHAQGKIVITI
jgi:NADPH:quinone reductase-like Zn-dependent oxidoreductase